MTCRAHNAQPNAAHSAIAKFTLPSFRHKIAPGSSFTLITQNVDGLSQRALEHELSSSTSEDSRWNTSEQPKIIEMHGKLFDVLCTSESCQHSEFNLDSPICKGLAGTENLVEDGVMDPDIPHSALPHCSKCNSLARPGVVWFGESLFHADEIEEIVDRADLCLVVGTSSTVSHQLEGYRCFVQSLFHRSTLLQCMQPWSRIIRGR